MINLSTRAPLVACLLLAGSTVALAGGFSIYEAGAKATGMGCAVTASVDDGSAMFYNIAGMSFMPGTVADLNVMPVAPIMKFGAAGYDAPDYQGETVSQSFIIPGVGVTHNTGKLAFGVGLSAPFGLGVEWQNPEQFPGRFTSYDVDLATVYITPAVSYLVTPTLSLAVGVDIAYQHIELNRRVGQYYGGDNQLYDVMDVQLEGDSDLNTTLALGLMYKPTPKMSVGVMYHHEKTLNYEGGTGTLTALDGPLQDAVAGLAGEYDLSTELGLPHMLSIGVGYQVAPRLYVEVNAVHFGWSNFEELALTFDPDPSGSLSSVIPENYEDKWQFRLGLDYTLNDNWSLLAGYARDESPQPKASMGALLPDGSRNDFSFGAEYATGAWRFTASYMAVLGESRDNLEDGRVAVFDEEADDPEAVWERQNQAGEYSNVANIWAFGIGRQF